MEIFERKKLRLDKYDYSENGAYFLTICTHNRLHLFGDFLNGHIFLSEAGKMVERYLKELVVYADVGIDKYVVMPNHLHAIIVINHDGTTRGSFPTLSEYIRRLKMITTKSYIDGVKAGKYPSFEKAIWQKSFFDHIIRNEKEYLKVWKYIDENPLKWEIDEYFTN